MRHTAARLQSGGSHGPAPARVKRGHTLSMRSRVSCEWDRRTARPSRDSARQALPSDAGGRPRRGSASAGPGFTAPPPSETISGECELATPAMIPAIVLIVTNVVLASAFGWPLAKRIAAAHGSRRGVRSWLLALLGVYVAECVAFSASMATNVLGYCLAVVWGVVFARRLSARETLSLSLYTCLPAISFLTVLIVLAAEGWALLSVEDGRRFGVPAFVPWPFCTLLGFFLTVSISATAVKTAITTITAARLRRRPLATDAQPGRPTR